MAAKHFYRQGFLLLLFNFISTAALEKRFSDFKRCADEECSMLLCRGKAMKDFSGPDCRFLKVKQSETIYVYYKLAGKRSNLWAGSVGSSFGYFPNDVIAINHLYTDKEIEVPAEETDFVCFDTGFDKFDNYDVDLLLGSSLERNDSDNKVMSEQTQATQTETQPSIEEATHSEEETDHHDEVPDDQSASLFKLEEADESPSTNVVESDTEATPDDTERDTEVKKDAEDLVETVSESSENKDTPAEPKKESVPMEDFPSEHEPVSISEGAQIPDLKTTFGATFDAVITDNEVTNNVTPYEEREEHMEDDHKEENVVEAETPLLSYTTKSPPAPDTHEEPESPPETHDEPAAVEEKNVWTSLGDAVFSVVTGGERTPGDLSSEEDEDDDDYQAEEVSPEPPQNVEEEKTVESQNEPEIVEEAVFVHDDESDGEVVGPDHTVEETFAPTEEPTHHQTDASNTSVEPVSQDEESASPVAQVLDIKTTEEPVEHKKEEEEVKNDNDTMEQSEDKLDETKPEMDQELIETQQDLIAEVQSNSSDVEDSESNQIHDHVMSGLEHNDSQPESPEEQPEVHEEHHTEEWNDEEKQEQKDDTNEELLEDENALSFSQTATVDSNEPPQEPAPPTEPLEPLEPPEPEYSDSVLRLTLLRDHFTEETMAQIQKLLGLKNLFKVEAMFSDLDAELRSARITDTGNTQDVENALEGILEASEGAILDEIEKMLDSWNSIHGYDQQRDTGSVDEETEILDDFQELAFSLRQKYSTASDSTPLATEIESDVDKDEQKLEIKEVTSHVVVEEEKVESVPEAQSETTHGVVEEKVESVPEAQSDDNRTVTGEEERPATAEEEQPVLEVVHSEPDVSVDEDVGRLNTNIDNQPSFSASDGMQKVPQATLETPVDVDLSVEVEDSTSAGSLDPMRPESEIHQEEEAGIF